MMDKNNNEHIQNHKDKNNLSSNLLFKKIKKNFRKNSIQRYLLAIIVCPLFVVLLLVSYRHHIILNVLDIIVIGLCAIELNRFPGFKQNRFFWLWAVLIAITPAVLVFLFLYGFLSIGVMLLLLPCILLIYLFILLLTFPKKQELFFRRMIHIGVLLFYPSLFLTFFIPLSFFPYAQVNLFFLFGIVFFTDSFAYLGGHYLGRHKNIVPMSPNKSLEGFIVGFLATLFLGIFFAFVFYPFYDWLWIILVSIGVSFACIVGDLFESALKRSLNIKDSGSLIFGRGGIIDSIDSFVFAIPVFSIAMYSILGR